MEELNIFNYMWEDLEADRKAILDELLEDIKNNKKNEK